MTVLVTGGAGFIGAHLVEALVAAGEEVVVLDNLRRSDRARLDALAHARSRCTSSTSWVSL